MEELRPKSHRTESEAERILPFGDNRVQNVLIMRWGQAQGADPDDTNALTLAWIAGGLAKKYRRLADGGEEGEIDIEDMAKLDNLLLKIENMGDTA